MIKKLLFTTCLALLAQQGSAQVAVSDFKSNWMKQNCAKEYNRSVGNRAMVVSGEKICSIVDKAPSLELAEKEALNLCKKARGNNKRQAECVLYIKQPRPKDQPKEKTYFRSLVRKK